MNFTDLASIEESAEVLRYRSWKGNMNRKNAGHTMSCWGLVLKFKYNFSGYVRI